MTGFLLTAVLVLLVLLFSYPVGIYIFHVMQHPSPWGTASARLEKSLCELAGIDPNREMSAQDYGLAVMLFSAIGCLFTFLVLRFQSVFPFNPQGYGNLSWHLALNTAVSFTTNTNWQSYGGESTLSYFSQAVGLTFHNFTSAAVGLSAAVAMARGMSRRDQAGTLGNFWRDLIRTHLYLLLPISLIYALFLVASGVPQTWASSVHVTTLEGTEQVIALGPVASQVAIKMLGTNGGGFFNANAAHPFENPSGFVNLIQLFSILVLPAGLVHTYGKLSGNARNGWAILATMTFLLVVGVGVCGWAETSYGETGNWEGKESRFGMSASALFAVVTTAASCGAVNAMFDSFTPLGGLVPMLNIQLGEIIFGGVGSGLYGMLVMVLLTVFLAGLMVGRTPELLGKKIEASEIKLCAIYILIFPVILLVPASIAIASEWGLTGLNNGGPQGWSEVLYAFTSAAGNNGSAFAGLTANTPGYNVALAGSMALGRFAMMLPALGIAGSLARKKSLDPGPGTFPTDNALFSVLLLGVIAIVGALTFFPAVALGPVAAHFSLDTLF